MNIRWKILKWISLINWVFPLRQPGDRVLSAQVLQGKLQSSNSELFKENPCALQIQLYYDEVEVCIPSDNRAKKQ